MKKTVLIRYLDDQPVQCPFFFGMFGCTMRFIRESDENITAPDLVFLSIYLVNLHAFIAIANFHHAIMRMGFQLAMYMLIRIPA
ncbi:hypothetical protein D3C87_1540410 [compost metagenome]